VNPHDGGAQPRPLPIRPRPATGESTLSYIRRLARANHLRPNYLRRCLRDATRNGIRLDWLATMAGRPVSTLNRALADAGPRPSQSLPTRRGRHAADKAALLAAIRKDAHERGLSIRGISDRHGVHRRTVLQALDHPSPNHARNSRPEHPGWTRSKTRSTTCCAKIWTSHIGLAAQ
jgi:lambda repressor-like predicted transcriptional regulator